MNKTIHPVPAQFGPETRYAVPPTPAAPFRATQETEFERLKNRLLTESLLAIAQPELNAAIRRAANDAAALAWVTFYPLLAFPLLFEEKRHLALRQARHQARVHSRSLELVAGH